jgi:ABA DEFICIENT 4-like
MIAETVFSIANATALVAWIGLVLLPGRRWVNQSAGAVIAALFAVAYVLIIAPRWFASPGGFSSLAAVATLFANPWLLLAGWIHYLAFDLLIGRWEARDSRRLGIPHLLVVPCLILTFMFGPAGWLLYMVVRAAKARGVSRQSLVESH